MKKKSLTFILLLSITLNAQWRQVGPANRKTVNFLAQSNQMIFAGTQGWTGLNTYHSSDEGATWSVSQFPFRIKELVQSGPNIFAAGYDYGEFYRSDNNGSSWEKLYINGFGGVYSLVVNGQYLIAGIGYGIAISTDNGSSWKITNPGNQSIQSTTVKGSNIYAGSSNGAFLSKNNGTSWSNIGLNNYQVKSIAVTNSKIFAVGNYSLYSSSDEGKNWNPVSYGVQYPPLYIHSVVCVNSNVFVASKEGVFLSKDNGATWATVFFYPCYTLLFRGTNLYAGSYNDGIFVSNDNGKNWKSINSPLEFYRGNSIILKDNKLLTATNRGICQSTDNGKTWSNISSIDIITNGTYSVESFDNTLYAGSHGNGVYLSKDNGITWTLSNKGIEYSQVNCFAYDKTNLYVGTKYGLFSSKIDEHYYRLLGSSAEFKKNIYSVVLDGSNLYVGTNDGLFVSLDSGTSWKLLGAGSTPSFEVYSIHKYNSTVFLGTSLGIYKLSDDRTNYILVNNSAVENKAIRSITDYESILYAGSLKGEILSSSDNGNNWVALEARILTDQLNQIVVTDSTIFASAYNGIWKLSFKKAQETTDTIETKPELPSEFSLSQNYPNPFNPETTIEYTIPANVKGETAKVTLKVYDLLGREVATLVDEFKTAGSYNSRFSIRNYQLTSGIYFYRLQAGNYSETKKLILMK